MRDLKEVERELAEISRKEFDLWRTSMSYGIDELIPEIAKAFEPILAKHFAPQPVASEQLKSIVVGPPQEWLDEEWVEGRDYAPPQPVAMEAMVERIAERVSDEELNDMIARAEEIERVSSVFLGGSTGQPEKYIAALTELREMRKVLGEANEEGKESK